MDSSPKAPVNTQKQTPPKGGSGQQGGTPGSGKKRERKKHKKSVETATSHDSSSLKDDDDHTTDSAGNMKARCPITAIPAIVKTDESKQVLQDKSNVEVTKSPGDKTEEKPQKSSKKDKQKQDQKKANKEKGQQPAEGGSSPGTVSTGGEPQKTKAELTAERRKKQEAQRAAKLAKQQTKPQNTGAELKKCTAVLYDDVGGKKEPLRVPVHLRADDEAKQKKLAKKLGKQHLPQPTTTERHVQLFSHLFPHKCSSSLIDTVQLNNSNLHPAIIKLGLLYSRGTICGSNARCIGLLRALEQVIKDYTTPAHKELSRDLDAKIKPCISFLNTCRRLSVSMGNAIRHLKRKISSIGPDMLEREAKDKLVCCINDYIHEKLYMAAEAISLKAEEKIKDDDVIIVYSGSSLVRIILVHAKKKGKNFSVIVIDSRPHMEGKEMVRRLAENDIDCSYVLISALSYAIQKATKIFLGAHALLANGFVMSRVGTSLLCMMAKSCNVPVLVFCETHKFSERVQTDSFVSNELGNPDDLVHLDNKPDCLVDWRSHKSLTLLNLVYDVTPPELVTVVITELGAIPCSSVPVVLRVQQEPEIIELKKI